MPSMRMPSRPRSASQSHHSTSFLPLSLPHLPQLQRPRTRLTTILVAFVLASPFLFVTYLFVSSPTSSPLLIDPSLNPLTFRLWPPGDPRARPYPQTPEGGQQAQQEYDEKWTSLMDTWDKDDDRLKQSSNAPGVWSAECRAAAAERARRGLPHWYKTGPLVFIGIFTSAEAVAKRSIIRTLFRDQLPIRRGDEDGVKVEVVFVSAQPNNDDWKYLLEEESREYGDVIFVDGKENIDEGKTYQFLKWVEKNRGQEAKRPRFVMKTDDDTYLVLPNLIRSLHSMDPCDALYWGTSQGVFAGYPPYFRGLGYALSWPLVKWLATSDLTPPMSDGTEDAKIGRFLQHLPESAVTRVDLGWKMGDWDQLTIDGETVAMHWLKRDEWVPMVERKVRVAWQAAGREYRWDWDRVEAVKPKAKPAVTEKAAQQRTTETKAEEQRRPPPPPPEVDEELDSELEKAESEADALEAGQERKADAVDEEFNDRRRSDTGNFEPGAAAR